MPADPTFSEVLGAGARAFNARRFFDAHETWEEGWRAETGEKKLLLQTLILVATALLQAERGKEAGVQKLLQKARERFRALPGSLEGVDVAKLESDVERWARERGAPFTLTVT